MAPLRPSAQPLSRAQGGASVPAGQPSRPGTLEDVEIELLLEGVHRHYGYDFRDYALSSVRRRLRFLMLEERVQTISGLKEKVLHDPEALDRLLLALSINVSAMFRDPTFYRALRTRVVPLLRTYPFVRVWHAGCSTGEEAYSTAILLQEAGIYDRCRVYATDFNEVVLRQAREGTFPLKQMRAYTENYILSGGSEAFSEYYEVRRDQAVFRPALRRNIVFAQHNLAMDGSFNEFHLILCRNVMIYFNQVLQARAVGLFRDSLVRLGFLCLGSKESLRGTAAEGTLDEFDGAERIYRKVRA